jgi:hypothetical protein
MTSRELAPKVKQATTRGMRGFIIFGLNKDLWVMGIEV